jgi:hypothetical protein
MKEGCIRFLMLPLSGFHLPTRVHFTTATPCDHITFQHSKPFFEPIESFVFFIISQQLSYSTSYKDDIPSRYLGYDTAERNPIRFNFGEQQNFVSKYSSKNCAFLSAKTFDIFVDAFKRGSPFVGIRGRCMNIYMA